MIRTFFMVLATIPAFAAPIASAKPAEEQGQARKEMRAGNILKSSEIERIVTPQMPGWQYLGFAYDPVAFAYRLKFIKDGRVSSLDVDARSGTILARH
ncbi:hypothetical protein [Novosphingobium sp. TH158]|uniref:hypothetical protein n=1 Tax=Novosphingobium sp. TH158 TaxID=2067455 RepID=UPI000C7B4E00|nr:hypothetical protein [Novosphingobium sp. TH158]PLK25658.1 hypothetical protein C0V78_01185 [Novosphingobium sp. TH158]